MLVVVVPTLGCSVSAPSIASCMASLLRHLVGGHLNVRARHVKHGLSGSIPTAPAIIGTVVRDAVHRKLQLLKASLGGGENTAMGESVSALPSCRPRRTRLTGKSPLFPAKMMCSACKRVAYCS